MCDKELTWKSIMKNYAMCKETAEVKSLKRSYLVADNQMKVIPEKILKVRSDGRVKCGYKMINIRKTYKELFGVDYKGVIK